MTNALVFAYKKETAIFWWGIFCLVLVLLAYGWCVQASVSLLAQRQNLENANAELGSEIAVLETEYLRQTSGITIETAYSLGFVDDAKLIAYALPQDVRPTLGQVSLGNDL